MKFYAQLLAYIFLVFKPQFWCFAI